MKKNFFAAALTLGVATLASGLLSAPAKAQVSADVEIRVEVPEVIYIQTYKTLTFKPNATEFLAASALANDTVADFFSNGTVSKNLPPTSGSLTPNTGSITTQEVLVYRTWGTGGPGGISHTVTYNGGTIGTLYLDGDTTSSKSVGVEITPSTPNTTAPGVDTSQPPIEGKVAFKFDFTNGTTTGTYSNPNQFLTITATGI